MAGRGRRFDEQLDEMRRIWAGEERGDVGPIGPTPARPGGPELILGGATEASFRRVARVANGWIMGGGTPDMFAQGAAAVDQAWQDEGRPGKPRKLSLAYFALGPDARTLADGYLGHYYALPGRHRRPDRGRCGGEPGDGEGLRRGVRRGGLRRAHLRADLVEPGAGRAAR
jgi:alkanesulfonate monooxygenase SsuD/methylene tetrahydromethanopterin reductase-like flavin-dependent oxidoreductase (luciferase family)